MLTQLLPEQIEELWDIIAYGARLNIPRGSGNEDAILNNIHASLSDGLLQCWVIRDEEKGTVLGMVLTFIRTDGYITRHELVIAGVCSFRQVIRDELWLDSYETLKRWARAQGCWRLVGYSNVPRIVTIAKQLGANTDYTFIQMEV